MTTALVIHGHFYQPPRENPWTNTVDPEPSASPYHDWNERIHDECYRPNGFARIVDSRGRVEQIVNNYTNISFNFGPTLLSWLEREHPATYARIIAADRESVRRRGGHGNAIAQGYHHAILPLCNERDRRTQVRWGMADFRHRFGREPESLWLPETAADDATLGTLIEEGLKYVILAPDQAERVRRIGEKKWHSVADRSIDPTVPYRYLHRDGSGRSISVFFYDGQIAKGIAFERLLASSHALVDRFRQSVRPGAQIVNVATDGESYGHHFHFGDRCLAYALEVEAGQHELRVTNYGEFLEHHPPTMEVEIKKGPHGQGTAWSCAHGVGRWIRDCGCHAGALEGWNQQWRGPLRAALDFLRDDAAAKYEAAGGDLFRDPWRARDHYIELLTDPTRSHADFLRRHARKSLSARDRVRALSLLEMQRGALVMYTSCGWFFNDISGIETIQLLKYAGRVIELMDELQLAPPGREFLDILAEAKSNIPELGNGADIYRRAIEASRVTPARVAAHLAISNIVDRGEGPPAGNLAGYSYQWSDAQQQRHGRLTLATGHLALASLATGQQTDYALAAMHFGEVDYYCALKPYTGDEAFKASSNKLWAHFRAASLPNMLRRTQEEFGPDEYGLEDLLPQGRRHISEIVFGHMVERFMEQYEFLYEENRRIIEVFQEAGFELPPEVRAAAEFTLGRLFEREIGKQQQEAGDYRKAFAIADEAERLGYRITRPTVSRISGETITKSVVLATLNPSPENFQTALTLIAIVKKLGLEANLERAQEVIYEAWQDGLLISGEMHELAAVLGLAPTLFQRTLRRHPPTTAAGDGTRISTVEATVT